jgi:hypothetical protein
MSKGDKMKSSGSVFKSAAKGFGNLFYVKNEEDAPETEAPDKGTQKASTSVRTSSESVGASSPDSTPDLVLSPGREDSSIMKTLTDALNKAANKDGYDYLKFAQSVSEQAKIIPAEETRFQATFAVARSLGVTQASLVDDAQRYLDVLKQEQDKFQTSVSGLVKENVSSKESDLTDIDKETQEKADQISKLTAEINDLQKRKTQVSNEVTQNKIKIEQLKSNFAATLKTITGRISGDVDKIKKYIPV